jgi:hypothetical protein
MRLSSDDEPAAEGVWFHEETGRWRASVKADDGGFIRWGLHDSPEKAFEFFLKRRTSDD